MASSAWFNGICEECMKERSVREVPSENDEFLCWECYAPSEYIKRSVYFEEKNKI